MSKFNITDKRFPKWDNLEQDHKFVGMLEAIDIKLISSPTINDVLKYSTGFLLSTWDRNASYLNGNTEPGVRYESQDDKISYEDEIRLMYRAFQGKFLPTFMESIKLTFLFNGVNTHDVTHFLRSRSFGFASDCTGDKTNEYRDIGVPEFLNDMGEEYLNRYKEAMNSLMGLYVDSMNHGKVSHLDSRLLLPRTVNSFYYVTMSMGDAISFIKKRLDRQIQPGSDNLIAIKMLNEIAKMFPFISTLVDVNAKNGFYVNETQSNFGSHYYPPNEANKAALEGKIPSEDYFLYNVDRSKLYGQKEFEVLWNKEIETLEAFKELSKKNFPFLYDEVYLKDWK